MNEWKVRDKDSGKVWHKDSKKECEEALEDFGHAKNLEIVPPEGQEAAHVTEDNTVVQQGGQTDGGKVEPVEPVENPESLSKDPIGFLESVNTDFVNTIKGTPAISKQGFRFIQREFEISTESKVVQWIDDPLGCVVWAKAEIPSGYSAEAHGEGYQFESDVSDNEFVRYADTRAKNRAISDLTSAGALAVSEMQGEL